MATATNPGKLEFVLACMAVVLVSGAFVFLLFTDLQKYEHSTTAASGQIVTISHPAIGAIFAAVYLLAGLRVVTRFKAVLDLIIRERLLTSLILLAALSALWSVDPRLTVLKVIGLVGTTLLGVYMAVFYSLRQQLVIMVAAAAVFFSGSIVVVIVWPENGVMGGVHGGRWNGVFAHKNQLGMVATMSGLSAFFLATLTSSLKWCKRLVFVLSVVLVILSSAKSAMATTIIVFCTLSGCALVCRERSAAWAAFAAAVVVTACLGLQIDSKRPSEPATSMATLTGRVPLWLRLGDFVADRPWLGYGYGAFWVRDTGPFGNADQELGWWPNHAHNGYLDIQLGLGLPGSLLFAALLAKSATKSFRAVASAPDRLCAYYYPLLLFACCILNFSESLFLLPNRLPWVLTVMAYCSLVLSPSDKILLESSNE